MLARQAWRPLGQQSRRYATSTTRPVPVLPDSSLETFRRDAFEPAVPALLPRRSQADMPAIAKWFVATKAKPKSAAFNMLELAYYSPVMVPIEVIHEGQFARIQQSFGFFLEFVTNCGSTWLHTPTPSRRKRTRQSDLSPPSAIAQPDVKMYIAQASLSDFPRRMQAELPTPEIVLQAGKGDVYDSSLWLGQAPTYTPLHRDPNPNLFVQLAGKKVVRLYAPLKGNAVFSKVQEQIGGSASATMRGEEMMQGVEKEALEEEVWGEREGRLDGVWQAELRAGDALFIPKGWWHSVKGVGEGINGSVNWWFR
ncbi:hypothetical protein Q7P37_001516 [Cladosporium fusiforme]